MLDKLNKIWLKGLNSRAFWKMKD